MVNLIRLNITNEENIKLKIEKEEDIFDRGYELKKLRLTQLFLST